MPKKTGSAKSGMDWTIVSQNVALGVAIVILSWLAVGMGLNRLPLVGVVFDFFMPLAFVAMMTYFRSEQKTKGQAVAEGVFAGCIFLVILTLVFGLLSVVRPPAA